MCLLYSVIFVYSLYYLKAGRYWIIWVSRTTDDREIVKMMSEPKLDSPLSISWHDSAWIPMLNAGNVLDYFSERSNPFYDRTCNNEVIKMQRLNPEQMQNMSGTEYILLHVQEPILYVIRKQLRLQGRVMPLTDYYIVAGIVYQAPDLGSVLNSRILSSVHHLSSAFEEARHYAKYHPSKGYWWDFEPAKRPGFPHHYFPSLNPIPKSPQNKKKKKKKSSKKQEHKEEPSSLFQRRRVDTILEMITGMFPPKTNQPSLPPPPPQPVEEVKTEVVKTEVKTEPTNPQNGVKREAPTKTPSDNTKKPKTS
ncbi:mediator of RNA polymerase II transcription subunit 6 [Lepeophtheirus salmonis]|uniref:mediator of RNA polymerase II transcription subunit 6 n=1 Tax=Lepeophtheirus salmonis TaxID=72036 RepID=UPI003AF3DCEB